MGQVEAMSLFTVIYQQSGDFVHRN